MNLIIDDKKTLITINILAGKAINPQNKKLTEENCLTAKSYSEGILHLKKNKIETLYLDCDLEGVEDGYDILKWLKDNPQHKPNEVCMVTNNPGSKKVMQKEWERIK